VSRFTEFLLMTLSTPIRQRLRASDYILPATVALAAASAAYAGADTTFDPALTMFTDFLEGSGGKIITVLSLAGGLIGLASGRFSLGQVAVPVGVGIGVGTGVPIVTSVVTATI
jgi:conjugal transfer pilus assembly protein TraA